MQLKNLRYRIYTHNIRYANTNPDKNEQLWEERRKMCVASIKAHAAYNSVVCLQEVLYHQLQDINKALGPNWTYYGLGRDDGLKAGEFSPVFYDTTQWQLVDSKTYWLSETPNVPSQGWDAVLPRIMTFVRLRHLDSGVEIGVLNTHFDHAGPEARRKSSLIAAGKMKELHSELPVTFSGDLNAEPTHEPYQILAEHLTDSWTLVDQDHRYGHDLTYTGFTGNEAHARIDYIWVNRECKNLQVVHMGVLPAEFHGHKFSDHRPVFADLVASA